MELEEACTKQDLLVLRSLLTVPREAQLVGEAVATLLRPKQNASFSAFRNLIAEAQFLHTLAGYDESEVPDLPERALERLQQRVVDPLFQPDIVAQACPAAVGLCMWVLSMYSRVLAAQLEHRAECMGHYLALAEDAAHCGMSAALPGDDDAVVPSSPLYEGEEESDGDLA